METCKSCGACEKHQACDHCGKCRECGKAVDQFAELRKLAQESKERQPQFIPLPYPVPYYQRPCSPWYGQPWYSLPYHFTVPYNPNTSGTFGPATTSGTDQTVLGSSPGPSAIVRNM